MTAIKSYYYLLANELKYMNIDKEIVMLAINNNSDAFRFASK